MRMMPLLFLIVTFGLVGSPARSDDATHDSINWPRFRGPNGQGTGCQGLKLPALFGPTQSVRWRTALPSGHSSPCIWGGRIYLTGFDKATHQLLTLCLERTSGKLLWRQVVPAKKIEHVHELNSPASSTPATDGEQVYVYFGSYGLLCYDTGGKLKWERPLEPIPTMFGSGTSPIVAGDLVLLNSSDGRQQFRLLALNRHTGRTVWQKDRPRGFATGLWSTPVVRHTPTGDEVIVAGGLEVAAYNLRDGSPRWQVPGLPALSLSTPALGTGLLVVTLTNPIGDPELNVVKLPPFEQLLKKYDKNKDGKLSADELPANLTLFTRGRADRIGDFASIRDLMPRFDKNKDKGLDRQEWQAMLTMVSQSMATLHIAVAAIHLDEKGAGPARVLWQSSKSVPEVPSPLYHNGRVYLVTERGILTCRDARSGKEIYRQRLGGQGACYSSPVIGDNKIYIATEGGVVVVFQPGDHYKVLAKNDLGERIVATPCLVDNTIYLRTSGHLYAFGG